MNATLSLPEIEAPREWSLADELADRCEIVFGNRVELPPMSAYTSELGYELARKLSTFTDVHGHGRANSEQLYRMPLPNDRTRSRKPDVAFVSFDRWPRGRRAPHTGAWEVTPDLVAEIISPSEFAEDVFEKVAEYFEVGVRRVWVIFPRTRYALEFSSMRHVRPVTGADALDGGDVLPGFSLSLGELLGPPEPAPVAAPG